MQQNIAQKNFAKRAVFRRFDSTQKSYEKRLKWPLFITFTVLSVFVFLFILHNYIKFRPKIIFIDVFVSKKL